MVLLNAAGNGVEVSRALVIGSLRPLFLGFTRRRRSHVHLVSGSDRDLGEQVTVCRIVNGHRGAPLGLHPAIVDEEAEVTLVIVKPGVSSGGGFWRRAISHTL